MSDIDYEIKEALQLRNQRFISALKFATTEMTFDDAYSSTGQRRRIPNINEAIEMADDLIARLEAPTL